MNNDKISFLAAAVLVSAYVPSTYAEGNISFSFSPPPITSVAAPGERINKGSVGYTLVEIEDTEFSLLNLNLLTKQDGLFGSLGFVTGEDDTGNVYMSGLAVMAGIERMLDGGRRCRTGYWLKLPVHGI